jgi:hypothetical protein
MPPERRRGERRTSPELAAYLWIGTLAKQASVRDISSTGVYLSTGQRWSSNDTQSLTLQRRGPLEGDFDRRVVVQAKAIRWVEDCVAMSFLLPSGMEVRLWASPLKSTAEQTGPDDILQEFRVAAALAFLGRVSAGAFDEACRLLREGLSNFRLANAVQIVLTAERMLSFSVHADRLRAPSKIVLRILEDGSWAEAESAQHLWSGLLATSCSASGSDESNLVFVDLLCQLTSTHGRILATACTKSTKFIAGAGRISSRPVSLSARELTQITGCRDLIRIHRDLEYLADLGLLKSVVRSHSFSPLEETEIAPTGLGLQLFARSNGYRGETREFYNVDETPSAPSNGRQDWTSEDVPRN